MHSLYIRLSLANKHISIGWKSTKYPPYFHFQFTFCSSSVLSPPAPQTWVTSCDCSPAQACLPGSSWSSSSSPGWLLLLVGSPCPWPASGSSSPTSPLHPQPETHSLFLKSGKCPGIIVLLHRTLVVHGFMFRKFSFTCF